MADKKTFKLGKQKIPRTWVYAGGAAVLGIAIYARFRGAGFGEEEPEPLFDEFGNPIAGPTPGAQAPGFTDSNLELQPDAEFSDNGEWTRFATSHLQSLGANGTAIVDALGKFLQRKPLSPLEASLVGQAVAVAGWPPDGRPWTIIEGGSETPPAATAPPKVTNLRATSVTSTSVRIAWDSGAASDWEVTGAKGGRIVRKTKSHSSGGLKPDTEYSWTVKSRNSAGTTGPGTSISVRTAPATGGGGGGSKPKGRPPAVRGVRANNSGRTVWVGWSGARSGHYRRVRWETATGRGGWVRAQHGSSASLTLPRTGRTYRIAVQQVRSSDGRGSTSARSNLLRT